MDYLSGSSPIDSFARKYARGLSSEYNEVHSGYISSIAESKLRTLSEIEAAEKRLKAQQAENALGKSRKEDKEAEAQLEADLIQLYNTRYAEALSRLKTYAEGRNYSDSYRDGLVRVPKS